MRTIWDKYGPSTSSSVNDYFYESKFSCRTEISKLRPLIMDKSKFEKLGIEIKENVIDPEQKEFLFDPKELDI